MSSRRNAKYPELSLYVKPRAQMVLPGIVIFKPSFQYASYLKPVQVNGYLSQQVNLKLIRSGWLLLLA